MNSSHKSDISAFKSAYLLLMRTAQRSVNTINQDPHHLAIFCQTLSDALENKDKLIHIVGVGRSRLIGMILGECLKNIGFSSRVFYLGENIIQPVKKNDVVIAITGSGWTKLTTMVLEEVVRKKSIVLTFTGALDSKAAKLSDGVIQCPMGYHPQDHISLFTREHDPLSPLGTIFELTAMITGFGVINGVHKGSCTKGFNEATTEILRSAENTFNDLEHNPRLTTLMEFLSDYCFKPDSKVFFYGNGINSIVATMSSLRLQSLGMKVLSINDWRFRREGDLLITLSGSGTSSMMLKMIENAKMSQLKVFSITSSSQSQIAKKSDEFLVISGRNLKTILENLQLTKYEMYFPKFEYATSITFESCIAQLAKNLGIPEHPSMESHSLDVNS
ncbi:MAG: SIS domain-containing protein [Candidatus Heimdallarchaeota archaeon]|nr:MAG: SIS domain-containing protein [Candidatus Heimdallarchaeota archaeon]